MFACMPVCYSDGDESDCCKKDHQEEEQKDGQVEAKEDNHEGNAKEGTNEKLETQTQTQQAHPVEQVAVYNVVYDQLCSSWAINCSTVQFNARLYGFIYWWSFVVLIVLVGLDWLQAATWHVLVSMLCVTCGLCVALKYMSVYVSCVLCMPCSRIMRSALRLNFFSNTTALHRAWRPGMWFCST